MVDDVAIITGKPLKGQIRPPLRAAIDAIVTKGLSISDAARSVGYTPHSLQVALKKPHVILYHTAVKRAWLESRTSKAWVNVAELADTAASEDVRLKANRIFLEAAGELGGKDDESGSKARTLINIVLGAAPQGGQSINSRLPGVIEAPQYRDISPKRPTHDQLDDDESGEFDGEEG